MLCPYEAPQLLHLNPGSVDEYGLQADAKTAPVVETGAVQSHEGPMG